MFWANIWLMFLMKHHSEFVFYTCMWSNAVQNAVGYFGDRENNGDSNDDISDMLE